MIGDGNCFFRATSKGLFDTDEHHGRVRSCITHFMLHNKSIFETYMISTVNGTNISAHIYKMESGLHI